MEMTVAQKANGGLMTDEDAKAQWKIIKDTIFPGSTDEEASLYVHDCKRQEIHPLDRLIHPTIRKDKSGNRRYVAITSIDLFRARAEDTGTYAGNDDPTFKGQPGKDGFEATVTVYKLVANIRCPFTATARWSEYKPAEGQDFQWLKMPHQMLGKCAEALALRKAFPRKLGGLYTGEEMAQADRIKTVEATVKEPLVVPEEPAKAAAAPAPEADKPTRKVEKGSSKRVTEDDLKAMGVIDAMDAGETLKLNGHHCQKCNGEEYHVKRSGAKAKRPNALFFFCAKKDCGEQKGEYFNGTFGGYADEVMVKFQEA